MFLARHSTTVADGPCSPGLFLGKVINIVSSYIAALAVLQHKLTNREIDIWINKNVLSATEITKKRDF